MRIIKTIYIILITMLSIIIMYGCKKIEKNDGIDQLTIKDIAFDENKELGYTIYIKENTVYVPYLVLTADYNDNALLLREDILDQDYKANDYSGYYKDSLIDKFLDNEFVKDLDPAIQNALVTSDLLITKEEGLGIGGIETESISRKVFLLSGTEIGLTGTSIISDEGKPLKYFEDADSRIAYNNKKACSWWLRTSYTVFDSTICLIDPSGTVEAAGAYEESGVRPAFCLSNDQLIMESNEVIEGQTVYIISD